MKNDYETIPLGTKLIEQEKELDNLFSARVVTPEKLETQSPLFH